MKKVQMHRDLYVNRDITNLKVRAGYKKYNDYNKIYCLHSQRSLLAIQALGKRKIRFTMPQYNYSEVLLLSLETALANLESGGGKVLLEEIELQMNYSIFAAMAASLVFITLTSGTFARVSDQQRYNDGYNAGQDYAACDYYDFEHDAHGYDMGCPNDKVHTYQYCDGYSLGYKTKWNSLAGETTKQEQTQSQAQGGSSVRVDGSHNNVIIAPRQTQEQSSLSSESDSNNVE